VRIPRKPGIPLRHLNMVASCVPFSSLEDRITDLCARVAAAKSLAEMDVLLPQMRAAVRDQIADLRALEVEMTPASKAD
jgi:hypothetical protein